MQHILDQFDDDTKVGFTEIDIYQALYEFIRQTKKTPFPDEERYEYMAFSFMENNSNDIGWGTYFGPMHVIPQENGQVSVMPAIEFVTQNTLDYWEKRATQVQNPILKARYLGLVWDFYKKITSKRANYKVANDYFLALMAICNGDYYQSSFYTFQKFRRALSIAISINNATFIADCKTSIITYGLVKYPMQVFDMLIGHKKVKLTPLEEKNLIRSLETKFTSLLAPLASNGRLDMSIMEMVAERLASYFQKKQRIDDAQNTIKLLGVAYQKFMLEASPMQKQLYLNTMHQFYGKYGLREQAKNTLIQIRKEGPEMAGSLNEIKVSLDVDKQMLEDEIDRLVSGKASVDLYMFMLRYIPSKIQEEKDLAENVKSHPLQYLTSQMILDSKGRITGQLMGFEDNKEQHLIKHVQQRLGIQNMLMVMVFEKMVEKSLGLKDAIINQVKNCVDDFDPGRTSIFTRGLEAFFSNDYLIAIHLLIPQMEELIRNIIELSGGVVLRKNDKTNGMKLRTLDDLLGDKIIKEIYGEDVVFYLKLLLTNPLGGNVRNDLCHGMLEPDRIGKPMLVRVIHSLLILTNIKRSKKTEKEEEAPSE